MLPNDKTKIEEYKKKLSHKAKGNNNGLNAKRSKQWIENIRQRKLGTTLSENTKLLISKNRKDKGLGDKRLLDDYVGMCPSCHKIYDLRNNLNGNKYMSNS